MNKEVKAKWLVALRSGDYIHGHSQLRTVRDNEPVKHCCLGVLCDLMAKEGKGEWKSESYFGYKDELRFGAVPHTLAKELDEPLLGAASGKVTEINDSSRDYTRAIKYIENYF